MSAFDDLVALVARLRAPDGCPWDREQTPESARTFVLEEAYEVVDAVDRGSTDAVREELGDLLFNVVLLAQMHAEQGTFTMDDVIGDIHDKMIRRHPHVFGDASREPEAIRDTWSRIKALEKEAAGEDPASAVDGVPVALPALERAWQLGRKASRVGFDWRDADGPRAKIDEELAELDEALQPPAVSSEVEHELGDLLFSVVNLARHLPGSVRPEHALRAAARRFEARFRRTEDLARARGVDMSHAGEQVLDALWEQAKAELSTPPASPSADPTPDPETGADA